MNKRLGVIANVIAILVATFAGFTWVNYKFEKVVSLRLESYENLILANSLKEAEKYDRAILAYKKALNGFLKKEINDERLASVIDPYLISLSEVEQPHKYEHHLNRLLKIIKEKLPLSGDRETSIAWIYLSTDRRKKSIKHFNNSISLFKQENDNISTASSFWGLSLIYLSAGDLKRGIEYYYKTWDLDYSEYNLEETINEPFIHGKWGKQLSNIYPKLSITYVSFIDYLKEAHPIKPRIQAPEVNQKVLNKQLNKDPAKSAAPVN